MSLTLGGKRKTTCWSCPLPHGMVQCGQIVLACAEEECHLAIVKGFGISPMAPSLP